MPVLILAASFALALQSDGQSRLSVDPAAGTYEIASQTLGWKLTGSAGGSLRGVRSGKGHDRIGYYVSSSFEWANGSKLRAEIRVYAQPDAVLFRLHYAADSIKPAIFPEFTSFPADLKDYSFRDTAFSPPSFSLNQTSTPWLFFNDQAQAMVFSPASDFLIAKMVGDGKASVGESLNDRLQKVPKGLDQDSLLVFGQGIQNTWEQWGQAMRKLYGRPVADPDRDVLIRSFGYWTDNGADYYYNYDPSKGYAGTLSALVDRYRNEGIPLSYMQLDSWWYQKSVNDASGKAGGATKNSKLPAATWNRYGGTMVYRASPDLFPEGLAAFQKRLGLPLATHGRWIDRNSPDHANYKFSGVGSIDPAWWNDTTGYLASSGVFCYEQDWLNVIYGNSPEMASVAGVADSFADDMARACARRGLSMQYCMAPPRFFLQGVEYPNLTTIRTSDDRFDPKKWSSFLYVSQLAQCMGIWPWCDVFKSGETGNMILAVLSGGPVGTGDALGKEDKGNILMAARPDGVIVKPDRAAVPCDQTYLYPTEPFLASTYTDQGGFKMRYFFAFPRSSANTFVRFLPHRLGIDQTCYLIDLTRGSGQSEIPSPRSQIVEPDQEVDLPLGDAGYVYFMLAPVTDSGIVFFGDLGKIVPTGKQRISSLAVTQDGLSVGVSFADGEQAVTLTGTCPIQPKVTARRGKAEVSYDPETKRFLIRVLPAGRSAELSITRPQ